MGERELTPWENDAHGQGREKGRMGLRESHGKYLHGHGIRGTSSQGKRLRKSWCKEVIPQSLG